MELATLKKYECKLTAPRPFIERIREKTQRNGKFGVYAKWFLWPETVTLLRKFMSHDAAQELVLVSDRGRPLVEDMETYGRKDVIAQAWRKLLVKAEMVGGLSFKYMRKTSAAMVRKLSGSTELAEQFLSHSDGAMVGRYAPRDWDRLGDILVEVREQLQPMFDVTHDA